MTTWPFDAMADEWKSRSVTPSISASFRFGPRDLPLGAETGSTAFPGILDEIDTAGTSFAFLWEELFRRVVRSLAPNEPAACFSELVGGVGQRCRRDPTPSCLCLPRKANAEGVGSGDSAGSLSAAAGAATPTELPAVSFSDPSGDDGTVASGPSCNTPAHSSSASTDDATATVSALPTKSVERATGAREVGAGRGEGDGGAGEGGGGLGRRW